MDTTWSSPALFLCPLTWLVGGQGHHGKLQGAGHRLRHWVLHGEELGQGQLPGGLGPALVLTHECPHPVWSHRDPLVYLGRQEGQVELGRINVLMLAPSALGHAHLHSHRPLWLLALGPEVSFSHGHLAPWGNSNDDDEGTNSTY
jgi:hypothetical protein